MSVVLFALSSGARTGWNLWVLRTLWAFCWKMLCTSSADLVRTMNPSWTVMIVVACITFSERVLRRSILCSGLVSSFFTFTLAIFHFLWVRWSSSGGCRKHLLGAEARLTTQPMIVHRRSLPMQGNILVQFLKTVETNSLRAYTCPRVLPYPSNGLKAALLKSPLGKPWGSPWPTGGL